MLLYLLLLAFIGTSTQLNIKDTVHRWAPLIRLAKNEPWKPSSVEFFLKHTKITHGSGPTNLTPSNLPSCDSGCFLTTKDKMKSASTSSLAVFKGQSVSKVPVYAFVDRDEPEEISIQYYTFYPYNRGKTICIGVAGSGKCKLKILGKCIVRIPKCSGFTKSFGHHVGDWEGIKVVLKSSDGSPKYIQFKAHGKEYTYNYKSNTKKFTDKNGESIRFYGSHPIVYSAFGSHGCRIKPGSHTYKTIAGNNKLIDVTSDGTKWKTWRKIKIIFKKELGQYTGDEKWVNFLGRWGNKRRECGFWDLVAGICVLNSGPKGPNKSL
ncbi:uncharacterized protein [Clytia hemisphaerica]|uniref:Cnidarian restricted protein n=1 Tax=Clytia hemisphaerica TaxID=252671 RepID=A0A7M5X3K1_9CNID|eukprot:TCONS_00034965-protein